MARRLSPSKGRSMSGSGSRATRISSGGFRSGRISNGGFKPRTSYTYGGFRRHYRPYRRNYLFHSFGPVGKAIYLIIVLILFLVLSFL